MALEIDVDYCIDQIASGTLTKRLAALYGIPKPTLRDRLVKHPKYAEAIKLQAESLVENATDEVQECPPEMPVIARARLRLEAAHKWAAARDPQTWGAQKEQSAPQVIINLVAYQPHTEDQPALHNVRSDTFPPQQLILPRKT